MLNIDQTKLSAYDIVDHRHRYACWTAARAVQRGYSVKTPEIIGAIENINLNEKVSALHRTTITAVEFDDFHKEAANRLKIELEKHAFTSYGRAAKIIAIYVKTAHILVDHSSALSRVAHPPIDSILLKNLGIKNEKWTELEEKRYFELIEEFRSKLGDQPFWKLEYAWSSDGKS
jgi:hypothetical protein